MLESVSSVVFNSRKFNKNLKVCQKKKDLKSIFQRERDKTYLSHSQVQFFPVDFDLSFNIPTTAVLNFTQEKNIFCCFCHFELRFPTIFFIKWDGQEKREK